MASTHRNYSAIIYDKRGKVLSIGKNSYVKSHPYQKMLAEKQGLDDKIFLHAEIDAILKCENLDKAHRISIFLQTKNGSYGLAKPFKICVSAIERTNIKIISHT